jgi:hypothetical protein
VEYLKNQLSGANMNKEINCLKNIIKQQAKELDDTEQLQQTTQDALYTYKKERDDLKTTNDTLLTELETLRKNQEEEGQKVKTTNDTLLTELAVLTENWEEEGQQVLTYFEEKFVEMQQHYDTQFQNQVNKITELKRENTEMQDQYNLLWGMHSTLEEQVNALMMENDELKQTISFMENSRMETMTNDQLRQYKEELDAEYQRLKAEAKDRTEKLHADFAQLQEQFNAHKVLYVHEQIAKTKAETRIDQLQKQLNDKDGVVMPEVVTRRLQDYKNRMQQVRTRKKLHNAVMSMLFLGMCLVSCWQPDNAVMYCTLFFLSVLFEGCYMQHKIKSEEMTLEQFTEECETDNVRFYNIHFSSVFVATETQIFNRHTRVWMPGLVLTVVCTFICLMCHIFSMTWVQEYCSEMLTHVLSFTLEDWHGWFRSSGSNSTFPQVHFIWCALFDDYAQQ